MGLNNNKMMKKALFLDRDGIINTDHGYVWRIEDFEFTKGIFNLVKCFSTKGYLIFVVTNQSGIARGYYTKEDFQTLTQWMLDAFQSEGITVSEVYYCPHAPQEHCQCRKPNTGMIEHIIQSKHINLSDSWMIGDKQSDIDFALNAGIQHTIAITKKKLQKSDYHFKSIVECSNFFANHISLL